VTATGEGTRQGTAGGDLESLNLVSHVCGRIAHDLNNLLAAVDGYAEFVAQDVADRPQVLSDITEVRSAAKKGAAFSRRLRQVGQLVESSPEDLDLSQVVRDSQEQVALLAGDPARCVYAVADHLPPVHADLQQVQLALLSVVQNACEAMPESGRLEVQTFADGTDVAMRVTDVGQGMNPEVLARMYEPFFSTKPKAIGNGLGMFIVDAVLRRAGGRVEATSEPGKGTVVTLLLPATGG
jgi:signal transduction histidine kinase